MIDTVKSPDPVEEKKGFDLTVHHRDPKSHRLSKVTNYIRHVSKFSGETHVIYERDQQFFYENGEEVSPEDNFVLFPKNDSKEELKVISKK